MPHTDSRTHRKMHEVCTNLWIHGGLSLFQYFINVVFFRNMTLRMVRYVCNDSINFRFFCRPNHRQKSQGCAPVNSYIFNKNNEASWYHLSRITKRTEAKNWYFLQNADDGSKIPSVFSGKPWVSSSPRIKASWRAGLKMVSRAIKLTCWAERS